MSYCTRTSTAICVLLTLILSCVFAKTINGATYEIKDLGMLYSNAYGFNGNVVQLNAYGQVTGDCYPDQNGHSVTHAFLYSDGQMHDLGALGSSDSNGYALNDKGQPLWPEQPQAAVNSECRLIPISFS
jgi:probable HAF family extracellular repeat protein